MAGDVPLRPSWTIPGTTTTARPNAAWEEPLQDGYRQRAFLMTTIDGRSRSEALCKLEDSLQRLQTDVIDLVRHHEVIPFEDPHEIPR